MLNKCTFCGMLTLTREHHIIPEIKGGKETVPACETCEKCIHQKWSRYQLRDTYNSVESILSDESFQKFLKWRRRQPATTLFRFDRGKKSG